jgi:uracil-DNA glycosylase
MDALGRFIDHLAAAAGSDRLANPYAGPEGRPRCDNLRLYLSRMAVRWPAVLLVGEAPGHRGCARTGVPFTSEPVLLSDPCPFGLFGAAAGFRPGSHGAPPGEGTATAVWAALARLDRLPLLWNALPFHPHRPGNAQTNRTPARAEVALGEPHLRELLDLFAIERVVAVGNQAASALASWGVDAERVRHPSHGGQRLFADQLRTLLAAGTG